MLPATMGNKIYKMARFFLFNNKLTATCKNKKYVNFDDNKIRMFNFEV